MLFYKKYNFLIIKRLLFYDNPKSVAFRLPAGNLKKQFLMVLIPFQVPAGSGNRSRPNKKGIISSVFKNRRWI